MRLRDVLARPGLGLELLVGAEADLDRRVGRVYVTDLLDPSRYLSGGELVLTGLMWRAGPDESETFAATLARAGVAAVGAGEAAFGSVPADLVTACRRHHLPLVRVPVDVSFQIITEDLSESIWHARATDLAAVLGRHRQLVSAMAAGSHLDDLLRALAVELGVACWVRSATGRLVAGDAELPDAAGQKIARAFLTADSFPRTVTHRGRRFTLAAVAGQSGHRLTSWCVVVEQVAGRPPDDLPAALEELLSLVRLERSRLDQERHSARRAHAALADALTGATAGPAALADLHGALHAAGLADDSTFVVAVAGLTGGERAGGPNEGRSGDAGGSTAGPDEIAADLLEELAAPLAGPVRAGAGGPGAVAVLALGSPSPAPLAPALRAAADALAPGLRGQRLAIGVSEPVSGTAALPGAAERARHAHRAAAAEGRPVAVVASQDLASYLLLLAGVPAEGRVAFRERLLGPLWAYDSAHHADLVRSLETFLNCSGSWHRSARELHVHVNTLRYRLRRVEELTGRDLGRFEDRVDLFLALRLPA